jgi:hypothetical protein
MDRSRLEYNQTSKISNPFLRLVPIINSFHFSCCNGMANHNITFLLQCVRLVGLRIGWDINIYPNGYIVVTVHIISSIRITWLPLIPSSGLYTTAMKEPMRLGLSCFGDT